MLLTTLCKLLQRQTYSCLSHRSGIYFAYTCLVVIVISAIHFSQELIELTQNHYEARFSVYSDNIASKSFRAELSSNLPIDVVYTWVNGSDPKFIEALNTVKAEEKKKAPTESNNATDKDELPMCHHKNCLLLPLLICNNLPQGDQQPLLSFPPFHINFDNKIFIICRFQDLAELRAKKLKYKNISMEYMHVTTDRKVEGSKLIKQAIFMHLESNVTYANDFELPQVVEKKLDWLYFDWERRVVVAWMVDDEIGEALLDKSNDDDDEGGWDGKLSLADQAKLFNLYYVNITRPAASEVNDDGHDIASRSRFEDNDELRFSIRSVVKHAPWVRRIFVVTNGQIPSWLDMTQSRVSVVTHEEIFPNKSHLPTFSSPAIESHLHRIDGLSRHFIYMNDDVFFGREVWPDDFYTRSHGYKVYLTWPVPDCAEGCPASWIGDGFCDLPCNNTECDFDGGECLGNVTRSGVGMEGGGMANAAPNWSSHRSNNCHKTCTDFWLADKYCDRACDCAECAFDMGDCGVERYNQLLQVEPDSNNTVRLNDGHYTAYMKLTSAVLTARYSEIEDESDGEKQEGSETRKKKVRSIAVNNHHKVLTFLLMPNTTDVRVKLTLFYNSSSTVSTNSTHEKVVYRLFANPSAPRTNLTEAVQQRPGATTPAPFDHKMTLPPAGVIPGVMKPRREEIEFWSRFELGNVTGKEIDAWREKLSPDAGEHLRALELQLENGRLTRLGFKRRSAMLILNSTFEGEIDGRERFALPQKRHPLSIKDGDAESGYHRGRKLLDAFGDSLRYVSKIYNRKYGTSKRRVPAHMPHFIDGSIMRELQDKFAREFDATSSHRLRHGDDMQFAFSYFYYLMSERSGVNASRYFHLLDTDHSRVLSDRELRTLATRIYDPPLTLVKLSEMEKELINCGKNFSSRAGKDDDVTKGEVYFDKEMPQITHKLFTSCPFVAEKLESAVGNTHKYKYQEMDESEVSFKMLRENVSVVVGQLDDIRRKNTKFICLNDNVDHNNKNSETVKVVVRELLEHLYPEASVFELNANYRNRFNNMRDLNEFKTSEDKRAVRLQLLAASLVLVVLVLMFQPELSRLTRQCRRHLMFQARFVLPRWSTSFNINKHSPLTAVSTAPAASHKVQFI